MRLGAALQPLSIPWPDPAAPVVSPGLPLCRFHLDETHEIGSRISDGLLISSDILEVDDRNARRSVGGVK